MSRESETQKLVTWLFAANKNWVIYRDRERERLYEGPHSFFLLLSLTSNIITKTPQNFPLQEPNLFHEKISQISRVIKNKSRKWILVYEFWQLSMLILLTRPLLRVHLNIMYRPEGMGGCQNIICASRGIQIWRIKIPISNKIQGKRFLFHNY